MSVDLKWRTQERSYTANGCLGLGERDGRDRHRRRCIGERHGDHRKEEVGRTLPRAAMKYDN